MPEPLLYAAHLSVRGGPRRNWIRGAVAPVVSTVTALSKVTVSSMVSPGP